MTSSPLPQVTQLASYFEPLVLAAVGVVSKLMNHQQQMTLLDQTKTLAESALQMLYAAKEGGGNPKVGHSLTYRERLTSSKGDLLRWSITKYDLLPPV